MTDSVEKDMLTNLGKDYEHGFSDPDRSSFKSRKGLD